MGQTRTRVSVRWDGAAGGGTHVDILDFLVVCAFAVRVDETPIDARDEVAGDDEFHDRMERIFARNNHGVEFLGL